MQATTLVSVEEYGHMTFEHDAEYVLGRIIYRPRPQFPHARLQATLTTHFCNGEPEWGLIAVTEQRVRIAPGIFRIPDICLLRQPPGCGNVTEPPVIAIEILSPDESAKELSAKIVEYLDFGVEAVWVMDPLERNGTVYPRDSRPRLVEDGIFRHGSIEVNIRALA